MSTRSENVGCFEVTATLASFVEIVGGKTQSQVAQRQFVTKPGAAKKLYQEVLDEISAAIGDASPTIELVVEDNKEIVGVVPKHRPLSGFVAATPSGVSDVDTSTRGTRKHSSKPRKNAKKKSAKRTNKKTKKKTKKRSKKKKGSH